MNPSFLFFGSRTRAAFVVHAQATFQCVSPIVHRQTSGDAILTMDQTLHQRQGVGR